LAEVLQPQRNVSVDGNVQESRLPPFLFVRSANGSREELFSNNTAGCNGRMPLSSRITSLESIHTCTDFVRKNATAPAKDDADY